LWRSVSQRDAKVCGPHAKTCKGSACFMRQCKHCPVYQYMSGCVDLTPWQIADLEMNRRRSELRMRRVGAVLLCEDTFNQTTCVCNRRDKCNSIHARLPFSTYSEGIFKGVVNFDEIIADLDPSRSYTYLLNEKSSFQQFFCVL
uniref:Nuclear receptor domain-containing protein n=1 Tax=Angiostrongylus cantonensis TaxID=6313 RepID=A0A0K0D7C6_ANGCA